MSEQIQWGDPARKDRDRSYGDRRGGGGRRFDRGPRDRGPTLPMPINFLADMIDTTVNVVHWVGNDLTETKGQLKALDGSGNTVLEVDEKVVWYRGATVQRIEFEA